jgi:LPXTG-motif cell wall-anchored protein
MRKLMLTIIVASVALLAGVPAGAAQTSVTITGTGCAGGSLFCYSPANVTVSDGDTVVWTNQTSAPHTVTRCTPAACAGDAGGSGTDTTFTTGNVAAGNGTTFSHTFHGPGTYTYYCTIHGFAVMHATVTVMAAPTITTTPATIAGGPGPGAATPTGPGATSQAGRPTPSNASRQVSNRALPHTGADASLWAIVAAALLGAGAVLAFANRRGRRALQK